MQVSDVMSCDVVDIDAKRNVLDAARAMAEGAVASLVVTDFKVLIGIVTERDVVIRAVAACADLETTRVTEIMTRGVFSCLSDAPLWEAQQLMRAHGVRRLVAVDRSGAVEGIVSTEDLATAPREELEQPSPHLAMQ